MIVVFLGPPGVGKGTQCQRLAIEQGWGVISTGEILRQAMQTGSPLGKSVRQYLDAGRLVPDETVFELVEQRMSSVVCREGCILDGFPRTVHQAEMFEGLLRKTGRAINATICFCADDDELRRRLLQRATKEGRSDDTPSTISERLEVYRQQTAPLIRFYQEAGCLYEVDAMGSPDQVYQLIRNVLRSVGERDLSGAGRVGRPFATNST